MPDTVYLFGEAQPQKPNHVTASASLKPNVGQVENSEQMIASIRSIVNEKHVKKIFVQDGSVLVKPIILNFPDVNAEVLHVDQKVQRFIDVTRQEISDSIARKEKLLSEFADIRAKPTTSETSRVNTIEEGRFARVLEERMKGLKSAEELFRKLDEAMASIELEWVDQIHYGFIDPSLIVCGSVHVYSSKEDIMDIAKSGRLPELLKEKGFNVEIVYIESEEQV